MFGPCFDLCAFFRLMDVVFSNELMKFKYWISVHFKIRKKSISTWHIASFYLGHCGSIPAKKCWEQHIATVGLHCHNFFVLGSARLIFTTH